MSKKIHQRFYRYLLFVMLAFTRFLSRADYHVPTKWYSIIDSVRVSSGVLHERISNIDYEIEREFRKKEEMIDRRLGKKKFYSEDEIEELQERINEIQI